MALKIKTNIFGHVKTIKVPTLVMSDILPARGGPERAARPPPAVSRPNAGVNKWKLGRWAS